MKFAHWIQVGLAVLSSAALSFAEQDPSHAAVAQTISHIAVALLLAMGLASSGINGPPPPASPVTP